MIARIIVATLLLATASSFASPPASSHTKRWNPASGVTGAERDIASSKIRFAYVGGVASHAPGLPEDGHTWLVVLRRYPRLEVGPQGCMQDQYFSARQEYARRYNQRMWKYVSEHR